MGKKVKFSSSTLMAYKGKWGISPLILNPGARWRWTFDITPWSLYIRGRTPVRWAPQPVSTFLARAARIRAPDRQAHNLVATLTILFRLPTCIIDQKFYHLTELGKSWRRVSINLLHLVLRKMWVLEKSSSHFEEKNKFGYLNQQLGI